MTTTIRTQGITAIYRGLSALIIGTAAKAGVRFFAFDQFKDMLKDKDGRTTGARNVLGKFQPLRGFVLTLLAMLLHKD